jgi:hypothetical protein
MFKVGDKVRVKDELKSRIREENYLEHTKYDAFEFFTKLGSLDDVLIVTEIHPTRYHTGYAARFKSSTGGSCREGWWLNTVYFEHAHWMDSIPLEI